MSPPPLRGKPLSPTEGPRPPRRPPPGPAAPPPGSSWTEAKVRSVLEAYRSFVMNASRKHQVDPGEVVSLIRDHLSDPDPDG
jgi:hypothetical protein